MTLKPINKYLTILGVIFLLNFTAKSEVNNSYYREGLLKYSQDIINHNLGKLLGLSVASERQHNLNYYIYSLRAYLASKYTDDSLQALLLTRDYNRIGTELINHVYAFLKTTAKGWHKYVVDTFIKKAIRDKVDTYRTTTRKWYVKNKADIEFAKRWYDKKIKQGEKTKAHLKGYLIELITGYRDAVRDYKISTNNQIDALKRKRPEYDKRLDNYLDNFPSLSHLNLSAFIKI